MELEDARRLTGPNVIMGLPGTVLDIRCKRAEQERVFIIWQREIQRLLDELGWASSRMYQRRLQDGISVAFTAPIDVLYAATAVNEWAYAVAVAELADAERPDYTTTLADIRTAISEEANPELLEIAQAASANDVTLLWDDDEVSLGMGASTRRWPAHELPSADSIDWNSFRDVPISIITGTNGKTTTARFVRHILSGAGFTPGLTSTDWVAVGDTIIERGDWSGPGGARTSLRHPKVDIAVLETARGGLLRRGLGVEHATSALITNIAEDHLGDFGSATIDELLDIKWIVSQAVLEDGSLILNADDERLVARAAAHAGRIVWFSLHADNPVVGKHTDTDGVAFILSDGELQRVGGVDPQTICSASAVPLTLGGAARHNIANALAAAAVCDSFGVSLADIGYGLCTMSQDDNPGRCNVYQLPQCKVLVDFAHNPHAMQALFDMAGALPAKRRILAFGQAGDRTDRQIRELAESAWAIGLDHVIVSELAEYSRGRAPGEVFGLIRQALLGCGAEDSQIQHCMQETESLDAALMLARQDDLIIMLALGDSVGVRSKLTSLSAATD